MVCFPYHYRCRVAVQHRRNDAAVNKPKSVVVLGPRYELSYGCLTISITLKMESFRVRVTATEAHYLWI